MFLSKVNIHRGETPRSCLQAAKVTGGGGVPFAGTGNPNSEIFLFELEFNRLKKCVLQMTEVEKALESSNRKRVEGVGSKVPVGFEETQQAEKRRQVSEEADDVVHRRAAMATRTRLAKPSWSHSFRRRHVKRGCGN